jgi:hypothetical protein
MTGVFEAIGQLIGLIRDWINPANKKKRQIDALKKKLEKLQRERDTLIASGKDPERLGAVLNEIIRVKKEIYSLELGK